MHKQSLFLALALAIASVALPVRAQDPIPDSQWEDEILYRRGHSSLLIAPPKQLPFFLLVDDSGTGFLADFDKSRNLTNQGTPDNWAFLNVAHHLEEHMAWTHLTKNEARALWGEPCKRSNPPFLTTFDAFGKYSDERNLYHLDFSFDNAGVAPQAKSSRNWDL